MRIIPVILAGGSGTRLWPLSRKHFPKQFHALIGDKTLVQNTLLRLKHLAEIGKPLIFANDDHRFLAAEQVREIGMEAEIFLEPVARGTAPAATAAALAAMGQEGEDRDPVLFILPADHHIADLSAFRTALGTAVFWAAQGRLVTFGIAPTRPETGYGYLETGEPLGQGACHLVRFVEKPSTATAQAYLDSGRFLWNSGMFVFRAGAWLEAVRRHAPDLLAPVQQALNLADRDLDFMRLDKEAFSLCPSDSIDYAVMERVEGGAVVRLDSGWNDIGSWDALMECVPQDETGNAIQGDVAVFDTRRSIIHATSRFVATLGVEDAIVVETSDAVLVTCQAHAQDVREIVKNLEALDRSEHSIHRTVRRPWGAYDCLGAGPGFQVKHIVVKPGASLSLQWHHHRAEHWVVVRGKAKVIRGDEEILLSENQSTYIPIGVIHRLENPGETNLEIIEVQSGSYLGEDDIERLADDYGRS